MVVLPNSKRVKVVDIGEITMKFHNDRVQNMTQVKCVHELNQDLFSFDKLGHLGYTVMMKNGILEVTKRDLEILKGWKDKRNLLVLKEKIFVGQEAFTGQRQCFGCDRYNGCA